MVNVNIFAFDNLLCILKKRKNKTTTSLALTQQQQSKDYKHID